jgi:uncharacterized protein YdeI (YjbR/CyaY-like superfamily)/uncharacterized protein YdhG (YjbR/CyaY superfamily)
VTVEEYLASAPEPQQTTLRALRAMLASMLPDAEEGLSYGVPAFTVDGTPVAGYAHAKRHCSYYPHSGQVIDRVEPELLEGYDWSTGTIRFPVDRVPDEQLVRRLLDVRLSMLSDDPQSGHDAPSAGRAATNPKVDEYIDRSQQWPREMAALRPILLDRGLNEEFKWAKPCYGHGGANIAIMQEMKGFLALMFFKGALLSDPHGVLRQQGPNSRSARRIEFTSVADVEHLAGIVGACIDDAIRVEEAGLEPPPAPELALVSELQDRLDAEPAAMAAFEALTPGRRREYNLYVSGAKQASTRAARVEKCLTGILAGKGLRDR